VLSPAQNPVAHGVHVRSATAVAAVTSTRSVVPPSVVPAQAVTATQSADPSAGPNVVPETHDVQEASVVAVATTRRRVPSKLFPVQVDARAVTAAQSADPSAGPNVVPATHDVQEASVVVVPATTREATHAATLA